MSRFPNIAISWHTPSDFAKSEERSRSLGTALDNRFATLAYLLWRLNPPKFKRIKIAEFRTISQQTWTFGVAEILNFVYDRADLTLLAFLTVNNSEISYYGTALNIALPVSPFYKPYKMF